MQGKHIEVRQEADPPRAKALRKCLVDQAEKTGIGRSGNGSWNVLMRLGNSNEILADSMNQSETRPENLYRGTCRLSLVLAQEKLHKDQPAVREHRGEVMELAQAVSDAHQTMSSLVDLHTIVRFEGHVRASNRVRCLINLAIVAPIYRNTCRTSGAK
jgi:hypothetical protein